MKMVYKSKKEKQSWKYEKFIKYSSIAVFSFGIGMLAGAAITLIDLIEQGKINPGIEKKYLNPICINPSELEQRLIDVDGDNKKEYIWQYHNKSYLLLIGKDGKPELREYSLASAAPSKIIIK